MNPSLIKHFKLSESEVSQIQSSLKPTQTLLEALFEKNLLDPVAYLAWAKEHYSLPVLKIEFLNQTNNVEALLERYKNVFPVNVIPFHEMDGVLYVMCLEPTPFQAPQTVQYVLAPYDVISKYASKNETAATPVEEMPVEIPPEKENTNPLFTNLESAKNSLENFSFESLTTENSTPTPEGDVSDIGNIKLEDKGDIPAGLNFPAAPADEYSFVSEAPVSAVDLNAFSFEGLLPVDEHKEEAPKAEPVVAPVPPPVTVAPVATAPTPEIIKPKPVKVDTSKPFTPATASSLAAKHPPKPKIAPETPSVPTAPPEPAVVAPPTMPQAFPSDLPSVSPIVSSAQASEFDDILNSMKKYFDQTMILLFNDGNLEPKIWDSTWAKAPNAQSPIDISTPSIFRIVNETMNPYHGHIVPNQINETFFSSWNKGQYPQHITICPIVQNKKMFGMILGTTTKEGAKKYQLHHIQEIAQDAFALLSNKKAA